MRACHFYCNKQYLKLSTNYLKILKTFNKMEIKLPNDSV